MRGRKSQARQRLCDNRGRLILHATNITVSRSKHGHRVETPRFFTDPASIPPELSVSLLNTPRLFNATFSHGSPLRDHELAAQVNRTIVLATADRYVEATHENTPDPIARTRGVDLRRQRRLQQVDHLVGQALLTQDDVELAGSGDLFEDFQFPQPHQDRVVRQQLGRVGL